MYLFLTSNKTLFNYNCPDFCRMITRPQFISSFCYHPARSLASTSFSVCQSSLLSLVTQTYTSEMFESSVALSFKHCGFPFSFILNMSFARSYIWSGSMTARKALCKPTDVRAGRSMSGWKADPNAEYVSVPVRVNWYLLYKGKISHSQPATRYLPDEKGAHLFDFDEVFGRTNSDRNLNEGNSVLLEPDRVLTFCHQNAYERGGHCMLPLLFTWLFNLLYMQLIIFLEALHGLKKYFHALCTFQELICTPGP